MQKKKGISLIVLVITIIVMIILAATIIISLSNNGIIETAKNAVDKYSMSEIQQEVEVVLGEYLIEKTTSDTALDEFLKTRYKDVTKTSDGTVVVTIDKYDVNISKEGKIISIELTGKPVATEVKVVENADGTGNNIASNTVEEGKTLYLTFTPTATKGKIVKVEPSLPYAVTKNGTYDFTITANVDGEIVTNTITATVNQYKYVLLKINYDELANGSKEYVLNKNVSGSGTDEVLTTEDLDWRLLEITEDGKYLVVPSKLLTSTEVKLASSKENYLNGAKTIDDICNTLYGQGNYVLRARSLKSEDLLRLAGIAKRTYFTASENNKLTEYLEKRYAWILHKGGMSYYDAASFSLEKWSIANGADTNHKYAWYSTLEEIAKTIPEGTTLEEGMELLKDTYYELHEGEYQMQEVGSAKKMVSYSSTANGCAENGGCTTQYKEVDVPLVKLNKSFIDVNGWNWDIEIKGQKDKKAKAVSALDGFNENHPTGGTIDVFGNGLEFSTYWRQQHTAYGYKIETYLSFTKLTSNLNPITELKELLSIKDSLQKSSFWLSSSYIDCSGNLARYGLFKVAEGWQDLAYMGNMLDTWDGGTHSYKMCPIVELDGTKVDLVKDGSSWKITPKQ